MCTQRRTGKRGRVSVGHGKVGWYSVLFMVISFGLHFAEQDGGKFVEDSAEANETTDPSTSKRFRRCTIQPLPTSNAANTVCITLSSSGSGVCSPRRSVDSHCLGLFPCLVGLADVGKTASTMMTMGTGEGQTRLASGLGLGDRTAEEIKCQWVMELPT